MEDQGIMALPQGMQAPTAQAPAIDPAAEAAFEQARMQLDPKEFGDEVLAAGEQADPAAVQEFKQALMAAQLPPEVIDAIGMIVDLVLENPANYQELRADLLADPDAAEVAAELLPPEFDAAYFGALNMALDQMSGAMAAPMEPQGFAMGGLAQTPVAAGIAQLGRNGDTRLAHITPSEARMLRRRGGSGTINPSTGLPEYGFFKSVGKAVGGVFKSAGKAISGAVKGIAGAVKKFASSTVGKVITAVALGFFLGPAAASFLGVGSAAGVAAVSGFVGGFGSSMLAGKNLKDSLKTGVIGGVTAGVTAGVTGGTEAFQAGSYTGPTTISGQFNAAKEGLSSLIGGTQAPAPITNAQGIESIASAPPPITPPTVGSVQGAQPFKYEPNFGIGEQYAGPAVSSGQVGPAAAAEQGYFGGVKLPANFSSPAAQSASSSVAGNPPVPGIYESIKNAGSNIANQKYIEGAKNLGDAFLGTTPRMIATGVGAAYLGGAFNPEPREELNIVPKETGSDLLAQYPEKYGTAPGGAQTVYAPNQSVTDPYRFSPPSIQFRPPQYPTFQLPQYAAMGGEIRRYAEGGIAALAPKRYNMGGYAGGGPGKFPRRTGPINGPGTGTSDSIPAMLSDGEFVMTAKAVRGAGAGSRREGAKRMYQMMHKLERKA